MYEHTDITAHSSIPTLACLFEGFERPEILPGQEYYDLGHDPFFVADEVMENHGLKACGRVDDGTLSDTLKSACCDGFFKEVHDPVAAADNRPYGPEMAQDLVDLIEAAARVLGWRKRWSSGAFLELTLLDSFDVDGLHIILPAIERMVDGYRDGPFDIHDHDVLDQMVLPFVRFYECLKAGADDDALRAFVLDGLRGRWPVTENEVLASIARVTSKQ